MIIMIGNRERNIPIRELSQEEADTALNVARVVFLRFKQRVPYHVASELESFLNEEAFFYACKWDGDRDLWGYLYNSLKLRTYSFSRNIYNQRSKFYDNPEVEGDEGESSLMWDKTAEHEDHTGIISEDIMNILNDRERLIVSRLYDGVPLKEIAEEIGRSPKTVAHIRKGIRDKVRDYYGDVAIGTNYRKREGNASNFKGGKLK